MKLDMIARSEQQTVTPAIAPTAPIRKTRLVGIWKKVDDRLICEWVLSEC